MPAAAFPYCIRISAAASDKADRNVQLTDLTQHDITGPGLRRRRLGRTCAKSSRAACSIVAKSNVSASALVLEHGARLRDRRALPLHSALTVAAHR